MNQLVSTITMMLLLAAPSLADDTVVVQTAGGERARWTGQILDFNGQELRLRHADGREQAIPADRVLDVESQYTNKQTEARRAWSEGRPDAAIALYQKALDAEQRRWVRRAIVREMVRCHRALGRTEQAGDLFLLLARDRPGVADWTVMPLAWSVAAPSASLDRTARAWMAREDLPAAVLLGASHLLSTDRAAATARLKRLAVDADGPLAQWAAAQLWRTEIVTADPPRTAAWRRAIQQMPEPLQAGPYYVLGRALARQGQLDEAALALLRAPILDPDNRSLAAAALVEAGSALEKLGRSRQAARLYREVLESHASTPQAAEARARWEALAKEPSNPTP
ncbi:MAG: tetratricopeptide repeat protein [Pirellulales bacterium]|nr:tetratricopeptide repeat protein [Pirellulales bacterium]